LGNAGAFLSRRLGGQVARRTEKEHGGKYEAKILSIHGLSIHGSGFSERNANDGQIWQKDLRQKYGRWIDKRIRSIIGCPNSGEFSDLAG
jgi:hypothetical protein